MSTVGVGDAAVEGGIRAAGKLLAAGFEETAILCRNDLTAIGVIRGLIDAGRRIPQDVSVVGYDDIELAAYVDPTLTTVRQSTEEMARLAVESLFERIGQGRSAVDEYPDAPPGETTRVPVELGRRNGRFATVTSGLSESDKVVVHPSDELADGALIVERTAF